MSEKKEDMAANILTIITVIIIAFLVFSCDSGGSSSSGGGRRCKVCGKEYDFNWSDVCDSCQAWHEGVQDWMGN